MTLREDLSDAEVQQLINMGKQRGYVTYEEMHKLLPTHLISTDRLEDVMIMFSDNDIEIVNKARKQAEAERRGQRGDDKPDTTRSNDPVRVYLRKMGSVSLLSREGEIEIAKRIEEGEYTVKRIVLTSPLAVQFIDEMIADDEERVQKALKSGKRPRQARTTDGRSYGEFKIEAIHHAKDLSKARATLPKAKSKKRRLEAQELVLDHEDEVYALMETLDLKKRQVALISLRIQEAWVRIARS